MTTASIVYNPFLPAFRRDPYPVYDAIREQEPVHRFDVVRGSQWLLTRYHDVRQGLADPRFVVDDLPEQIRGKARVAGVSDGMAALVDCIRHWLFFRDPPQHTAVRRIFAHAMGPATIAGHRALIESLVHELLAPLTGQGRFDLIAQVAYPLPARTMARLLGVPVDGLARVMQWSTELFRVLVPPQSLESYARMGEILAPFVAYFRPHVQRRRHEERDDLLGVLVAAEQQGVIDEAGVYALAIMLFSVGQETTENLIGNGLLGLLADREQSALVWDEPARVPDAVDEMLRYDTPVQGVARLAAEEVSIGDVVVPRGARVNFSLGAANRDPAVFLEPHRFEMRRAVRSKLAFGAGAHFCLGAHLARLQAEVVLSVLIERMSELRLAESAVEWRSSILLRGVKALPLEYSASVAPSSVKA